MPSNTTYHATKPEDEYHAIKPKDEYHAIKPKDEYHAVKPKDEYHAITLGTPTQPVLASFMMNCLFTLYMWEV